MFVQEFSRSSSLVVVKPGSKPNSKETE